MARAVTGARGQIGNLDLDFSVADVDDRLLGLCQRIDLAGYRNSDGSALPRGSLRGPALERDFVGALQERPADRMLLLRQQPAQIDATLGVGSEQATVPAYQNELAVVWLGSL